MPKTRTVRYDELIEAMSTLSFGGDPDARQ